MPSSVEDEDVRLAAPVTTALWPNPPRRDGGWRLAWAAVTTRACICTGCGSPDVRRSSVRTPLALRVAGMHLWRCRDCSALFPLRRRWPD
jgi:hypothetical protein